MTADDYIELLPARWHAVNAYGIKVNRRTYDCPELNPFRQQSSGVKEHNNRWEVHCDAYDISRIWVRDHWNGGWVTVFWTQLHRVAAQFGEMAWDHARTRQPAATEEELADAVDRLLRRQIRDRTTRAARSRPTGTVVSPPGRRLRRSSPPPGRLGRTPGMATGRAGREPGR